MNTLRCDAAARRELILDAADAVFSEQGVTAPLDLVVERAGVGRATLYRNFPNRTALMAALLARHLKMLEDEAEAHADRDDALFLLLERMARHIAEAAPLADFWRAVERGDAVIAEARQRIVGIFKAPMQRAIDAGLCRADLLPTDISLLSGMLGASLRGKTTTERRALAMRALELLRRGLAVPDVVER
ncbi:MAG: TetR/AcrR family transcriptional regulator [Lysobacter sp.]